MKRNGISKCGRCKKKTVDLDGKNAPDGRERYKCLACGNTFTMGKNKNHSSNLEQI